MEFNDLPINYRDNINNTIIEWTNDGEKEIIEAFKVQITDHLNNCAISELDILEEDEFSKELLWFIDGWKSHDNIKQPKLF